MLLHGGRLLAALNVESRCCTPPTQLPTSRFSGIQETASSSFNLRRLTANFSARALSVRSEVSLVSSMLLLGKSESQGTTLSRKHEWCMRQARTPTTGFIKYRGELPRCLTFSIHVCSRRSCSTTVCVYPRQPRAPPYVRITANCTNTTREQPILHTVHITQLPFDMPHPSRAVPNSLAE